MWTTDLPRDLPLGLLVATELPQADIAAALVCLHELGVACFNASLQDHEEEAAIQVYQSALCRFERCLRVVQPNAQERHKMIVWHGDEILSVVHCDD